MRVSSVDRVLIVERSRDPFVNTALPKIGCPENSGLKDKGHLSVCAVMHSMVAAITVVTSKWPRHSHGEMRHQLPMGRRHSDITLRPRTELQTIEIASHAVVARAGSNVTMPLPEMNTGGNTQLREGHLLDTSYRHQIEMISPPVMMQTIFAGYVSHGGLYCTLKAHEDQASALDLQKPPGNS